MRHDIEGARKCLLILDVSVTGHHPTYIRRVLESDIVNSADVIVASRKELFAHTEIRPFAHLFTPFEIATLDLDPLQKDFTTKNLIRSSWTIGRLYRETYRHLAKSMNISFVVVPFLDDCLIGLALSAAPFGKTPWVAITMRTMFHFVAMGVEAPQQKLNGARRYLLERVLRQRSLSAVLTIDPTLAAFAKQQRAGYYQKIEYLPDPALHHPTLPTKGDAKRQLNVPKDARVILLYGEIADRKGVYDLLAAAADPACDKQLHVLLAGRHETANLMLEAPDYQSLSTENRVHRLQGFIDDAGERLILAASDCMWVGYKYFYLMSGIMVLAGRHGLPVIATRSGLIGYWTRQHTLGIAVDVGDRPTIVAALNQLCRDPQALASMGDNGVRAFSRHEPAVMQQLLIEHYSRSQQSVT